MGNAFHHRAFILFRDLLRQQRNITSRYRYYTTALGTCYNLDAFFDASFVSVTRETGRQVDTRVKHDGRAVCNFRMKIKNMARDVIFRDAMNSQFFIDILSTDAGRSEE